MPYLKEENAYWRLPEFLKFTGRTEYRVLKFLLANIVRDVSGHNAPAGAWRMYNDFFKKGLLCASYSQDDIARFFEFFKKTGEPNGAYISTFIKKLGQMKLLKIHKIPTPAGLRNVYELGYYKGTYGKDDDYDEFLYFDQYFGAKVVIHKLEKQKQKQEQIIEINTPEFVEELNGQIFHLEKELEGLNEKTIDSFR